MTARPSITAAIIAWNEAENLRELLPLLGWVDQVVVVDGGSHDDTVRVARSHGCCVADRRFDNFTRQRNYALQWATGDWVLSIDADERPTPGLAAQIGQRIARGKHAAFRVPIRSAIFGRSFRGCGTQDDRPIRLFRRERARWTGAVHEVLRVSGRVGRLTGFLEHRTIPNLHAFLTKMNRYTTLEAKERVARSVLPRRRDRWLAPLGEVFRRLVWKGGALDGPEGWAFCLLSGLSERVLADRHRHLWEATRGSPMPPSNPLDSPGIQYEIWPTNDSPSYR